MILWDGSCMVHEIFSVGDLLAHEAASCPRALTLAHPECPANIREHSDFVGGTEAMIKYVAGFDEPTDFLVATEANMLWQLQTQVPAAPLPPGAGHHLRLQQVPAHGPQHAGKAPRLPGQRPARDHLAAGVRPGRRGAAAEPARVNARPSRLTVAGLGSERALGGASMICVAVTYVIKAGHEDEAVALFAPADRGHPCRAGVPDVPGPPLDDRPAPVLPLRAVRRPGRARRPPRRPAFRAVRARTGCSRSSRAVRPNSTNRSVS